ncbi:hypothetical protein AB0M47_42125, partial [Hamadaea sp. NPDC051192]|uniref:hypothetical protein n=1 Tax=Hamadaea sp. NPDC051192 TaxID=3154940 RepID=UPI003424B63F
FKEVAESVRQHRGGDTYNAYRRRLNTEIKRILRAAADHPLKRILEMGPRNQLVWRQGTVFAGQDLHYAHKLSQQVIKNVRANPNLAMSPGNLEPVGGDFHLAEYGHDTERLTDYMATASEEARTAVRVGTEDLAVRRIGPGRPGQAGYITIGGLVHLAVVSAGVVVILRASHDRTEAVANLMEFGAGLAVQEIVLRGFGGGPAIVVPIVMNMRSDDPQVSRQRAMDEARRELVHKYVDAYLPETKVGGKYDPAVLDGVHQLLFEVPPTPEPQPSEVEPR